VNKSLVFVFILLFIQVTFEIVLSRKGIFDEYLENTKRKTMYTVCDMFDVIPNEFVIIADGQVY